MAVEDAEEEWVANPMSLNSLALFFWQARRLRQGVGLGGGVEASSDPAAAGRRSLLPPSADLFSTAGLEF